MIEPSATTKPGPSDAWQWWESRRLTYNLALGMAGVTAYALHLAVFYAFGWPQWIGWNVFVGMTLNMAIGYLIFMFIANVFYLLGMLTEGWTKPSDRHEFRKHIFALGLWGSAALPFLLPLATLAARVGSVGAWD